MRGLTLTGLVVAVVTTLVLAIAWFSLAGTPIGAVSSIESNSMSHGPDDMEGVLDPGEWRRLEGVDERGAVITFYEAREVDHRVGQEHGDVIAYRPNGTEAPSSPSPRIFPWGGDEGPLTIEHRALAWVEYNASAEAYDVPELGIEAQRSFTLPDVGTYDRASQTYVHRPLNVTLDPETAGRHDGFLTKGDFNPRADQDASTTLASAGHVELVPPERIEGKVDGHVDSSTIVAFQIGVPIAALLVAGGVYAWRRGHLAPLLPDAREEARCPACGAPRRGEESFCHSCGEQL